MYWHEAERPQALPGPFSSYNYLKKFPPSLFTRAWFDHPLNISLWWKTHWPKELTRNGLSQSEHGHLMTPILDTDDTRFVDWVSISRKGELQLVIGNAIVMHSFVTGDSVSSNHHPWEAARCI